MRLMTLIIAMLIFSACHNNTNDNNNNKDNTKEFFITQDSQKPSLTIENRNEEMYKLFFSIGSEISSLSNIPEIEKDAVIVNGKSISKKDIEIEKIQIKYSESNITLKERITVLIKNMVLTSEANRLKIEPSQKDIASYMDNIKISIEHDNGQISGYINGTGITIEEFILTNEKMAYNMYQRRELWKSVKSKKINKQIQKEAEDREISFDVVDKEYYEKYAEELMSKANIQILDEELKIMFANGF